MKTSLSHSCAIQGRPAKVKEKGLFRLEGKDYVIKEADVVYFRFNV